MKVCFHDNALTVRGTTNAMWDYIEWSKKLYGIEPIVMYSSFWKDLNQEVAINRFKEKYPVFTYTEQSDIDDILKSENVDVFFMIKGGKWDGVISHTCENWINAIGVCGESDRHGEKYAMGSRWLSRMTQNKIDYVSYMVNLPDIEGNLRDELGIPKDAIVFGRNGGRDTFDLDFAKKAVIDTLSINKNAFFLFQGTERFYEHERIIHLPATPDMETKVKFINTCDALLHARQIGESFGCTIAEFSMKNKPVITWWLSNERNHIEYLQDKGIYYRNYEELLKILTTFAPNDSINWKCYEECLPEPVMEKFKKIYLS
jgi:hypothetical protein